jgi:hypothetical protein
MRIRALRVAAIATFTLGAAGLLGCSKTQPAGSGAGKIEGAAASALDTLPQETAVVVGFSWTKFKESKLYGMLQSVLPEESKQQLQQFKDTCNIDFLSDVHSIIIASGGNMDRDRSLMLFKGNWDEDKVSKCAAAMGPKLGKPVTTTKDGAITTYAVEGEQPVHVAWSGDTAMLTPAAMQGDKTYLADLLKQKSTLKANKAFMDILAKTDTAATFYAAAIPPENAEMSQMMGQMTGGSEKLTAGWITVKLGKDLDAYGGMRFATDAEAKSVAERMNKELDGARADTTAGEYLKSLTVTQTGTDVAFKWVLSEQQVDQLLEMAKQMLPMLGMMFGGG